MYIHLRTFINGLFLFLFGATLALADDSAAMDRFFDGSLQGEAGEAAVDRSKGPGYYHFTLKGLSAFASLEKMRVSVIPFEDHSARRFDLRVWTSLPTLADEEVAGYDFTFREETALPFDYYAADGELIDGDVTVDNIYKTGWIEVPLANLSMEDARTFRMAFEIGTRGAISMPFVEVTGILEDGGEAVTLVRYDFDQEGARASANQVHNKLQASVLWPQGFPTPKPIVTVLRPEGPYEAVQLHFRIPEGPNSYRDWVVFSGIRNDRMPVNHWVRVTEPGGYLVRDGHRFSGTFERQHRGEQPRTVTVNATIDGGTISGTVTLTDDNPWNGTGESWTGTVSGTITSEAELRAKNAIDPRAAWPRFIGPDGAGNTAQVRGLRTINGLDELRLQWGSEAIDVGSGIGSINRSMYRFTGSRVRTGGGSSSPVMADGKVYIYYSVPNPRQYNYFYRAKNFTSKHSSFETAVVNMAEKPSKSSRRGEDRIYFTGGPEDLPLASLEKIWEAADDVVICMDAATGQTLWRTRIENVGYNRQHHKSGPYNQTAAVHGGRIFAIGSGGWLHALDANTGEALWHQKVGGEHTHQSHAVLAIEEAVILPFREPDSEPWQARWTAYDPATGEELWRNQEQSVNDLAIPVFWRAEDGTPVILIHANKSTIAALNAATGATLFSFELPKEEGAKTVSLAGTVSKTRGGNPGNMTVHGNSLVTHEHLPHDAEDHERWAVAVYDLSLTGLTPRWRYLTDHIRGEWSPLVMKNQWVVTSPSKRGIMVFDLATGELKSERGREDWRRYTPGDNGMLMGMEDLVISQNDATHGQIYITFFKIDDAGQLTNLNPEGHMPLASGAGKSEGFGTGSYHHPVMQALVDGRLFLRERRGIMSYDLRAK